MKKMKRGSFLKMVVIIILRIKMINDDMIKMCYNKNG